MFKIKFYSSFCDSKNCKEVYERLCETDLFDFYGNGKKVEFTTEDDYTHVIIVNTAMPVIKNNTPSSKNF